MRYDTEELGWTAQLVSFMSEPFALCCSPRAKLAEAQTEDRPEVRSAIAEFFLGAEPAKLKASSGSDTESVHSGSETDSETQAHATSALVPPAPSSRDVETPETRAELKYLAALLVSNEVDPDATQELCVYAQSFDGPSACIKLLTTELMGDGNPPRRSLLPDAFAVVQELMGRLTLDAMQRESSDELSVLVALSHAIIKASLEECDECELECQECEEEQEQEKEKEAVEEEDPWLTSRTTTGRAPAIKTAEHLTRQLNQLLRPVPLTLTEHAVPASHKAVRFDVGREHAMPE